MKQYWLGIVSTVNVAHRLEEECWWCLPLTANVGDKILMYCTRAASPSSQGVFARCEVAQKPRRNNEQNFCCSGYGSGQAPGGALFYTELNFKERFRQPTTAADMKRDRTLSSMLFVRKNFQATVFPITVAAYNRILKLTAVRRK